MPATTPAPSGMHDLFLVCAVGLFVGGLATVSVGVTDSNPTFIAAPVAVAADPDGDASYAARAFGRGECDCKPLADRVAVRLAYAARPGFPQGHRATAGAPVSRRELFLGETAVMRERARAGRQDDPRSFLQEAALATRMRGVGLLLNDDAPPFVGDK